MDNKGLGMEFANVLGIIMIFAFMIVGALILEVGVVSPKTVYTAKGFNYDQYYLLEGLLKSKPDGFNGDFVDFYFYSKEKNNMEPVKKHIESFMSDYKNYRFTVSGQDGHDFVFEKGNVYYKVTKMGQGELTDTNMHFADVGIHSLNFNLGVEL